MVVEYETVVHPLSLVYRPPRKGVLILWPSSLAWNLKDASRMKSFREEFSDFYLLLWRFFGVCALVKKKERSEI